MTARVFPLLAAVTCFTTPAFGHAFLQHADPGAGVTIPASRAPTRVVLVFTERLEPAFSGVAVADSSGRNVAAAPVVIRGNSMMLALRPLKAGTYRVAWHVVSVDTHRTEGAYSFTVKP